VFQERLAMQITKAEVTPIRLRLKQPGAMALMPQIEDILVVFIRLELSSGQSAWGCTVSHPELTGDQPEEVIKACQECADLVPDLHPTNIEYSLDQLVPLVSGAPTAMCAFDLAFHDLLGLVSGLPLYRLLGGFRNSIQTSVTIPIGTVEESVAVAQARAKSGFRMLKIKGGRDPEEDVHRIRSIQRVLPNHILRLDADGAYSVRSAIEVARALEGRIEMLEQPTPADDLEGLCRVKENSPMPVVADQSVTGPESVLTIAMQGVASGICVKLATCGGLRCADQIDAIARAAKLTTMVSCLIEPALLISAGLSFALSSPNVQYADLDGFLELESDPSVPGFLLQEGWLTASEVPGLGCTVNLS
jgi:L-alanine-DL-glutamate epimerase-like enolase superfamily enzyme